jgi:phi LC3 family holin
MINWKVRIKNPNFWVAIGSALLMAMGISPEVLTSWGAVWNAIKGLVSNPYMLICATMAITGVINDPTTKGVSDSKQALTYVKPK